MNSKEGDKNLMWLEVIHGEKRWFYIKIIGVSEVENSTNKTEIIERHQFKKKKLISSNK